MRLAGLKNVLFLKIASSIETVFWYLSMSLKNWLLRSGKTLDPQTLKTYFLGKGKIQNFSFKWDEVRGYVIIIFLGVER